MEIKIDEDSFKTVARVLAIVNSEVVTYHSAMKLMNSLTAEHGPTSAYFGTAGFYIVCFDEELPVFDEVNPPHERIGSKTIRHAKAVLMPFSVERYLKQIGEMQAA